MTPTNPNLHEPRYRPASSRVRLSLLVRLIVVFNFLPEPFSFYLGGLRLTVTRVLLLCAVPIVLSRLGAKISNGTYRFIPSDFLVVMAGGWMFIAVGQIDGIGDAVAHCGPVALEFCIGYWSMRLLLTEYGHAGAAVKLLCTTIAVVAALGMLDPLADHYVIREWSSKLTGYVLVMQGGGLEHRHGILRATGPVEHPILFGLICGIGFLLSIGSGRKLTAVICAVGALLSFSAAPLQGIAVGGGLLVYNRLLSGFLWRWRALLIVILTAFIGVQVAVPNPMTEVIRHLTFDPQSGYDRLLQWHNAGGLLMQQSPWFGLGFVLPETLDSELVSATHSIDSLWLYSALQFGVIGSALIGLTLLGSTLVPSPAVAARLPRVDARLMACLSVVMFVIVLVGFTVHLWGTAWILVAMLAGIRAHLGELASRLGSRPMSRAAPRLVPRSPLRSAAVEP